MNYMKKGITQQNYTDDKRGRSFIRSECIGATKMNKKCGAIPSKKMSSQTGVVHPSNIQSEDRKKVQVHGLGFI